MLYPIYIFRKKKAVHKSNTTDDKKLQSTLKRIGVNSIPAIEEVNIFQDDSVIQFLNPKGSKQRESVCVCECGCGRERVCVFYVSVIILVMLFDF